MNELKENLLSIILDIINDIVKKSFDDNYIYRGEASLYPTTSSSLYRTYYKNTIEDSDFMERQKTILEELKRYLPEMKSVDDVDILAQLQHYGATTNLIDFTTDYLVALFFACEKEHNTEGRVLLLKRVGDDYDVIPAPRTIHRAGSQKSIFVQSPKGFIEIDTEHQVRIPHNLKPFILLFLDKYHGISEERIYNDIHGFIKSMDTEPHSLEVRTAKRLKEEWEEERQKPDEERNTQAEQEIFKKTIKCCKTALELPGVAVEIYSLFGAIYVQIEEYDLSIESYSEAIKRDTDNPELYVYRGKAYALKGELNLAVKDYSQAIDLNANNSEYYDLRCSILVKQEKWEEVESDILSFQKLFPEKDYLDFLKELKKIAKNEKIELPPQVEKYWKEISDVAAK